MKKIFGFEAKNKDFKVEIFSNKEKTCIRSEIISNAEIIKYTSNDTNEVFGRMMREIKLCRKVISLHIADLELNEEDILTYNVQFDCNEVKLNINNQEKAYKLKDIHSIDIDDFATESFSDLRAAIDDFKNLSF